MNAYKDNEGPQVVRIANASGLEMQCLRMVIMVCCLDPLVISPTSEENLWSRSGHLIIGRLSMPHANSKRVTS